MSLETKQAEQSTLPTDVKFIQVTGVSAGTTKYLSIYEQTVVAVATAGNVIIYLPNVTEAIGRLFSIYCTDLTGPSTVVVRDNDESVGWSDATLTADNDHILVYSDGIHWHLLVDVTT